MSFRILLGITGGIAAYKSAEIVRLLIKSNHQVTCVVTDNATQFITPLTLQTLSQNPVHHQLLNAEHEYHMPHIDLARWPDLILVAPASANSLAKFAHGICDDLLSTLYLATTAPVMLAPAMNEKMWQHPSTQRNISQLEQDGAQIIAPDSGAQACGDVGPGRLPEPTQLVEQCMHYLLQRSNVHRQAKPLKATRVVITAGPTQEALDPVRFITNHSSGKMGYALADAAGQLGAEVHLISGPTQLDCPPNVSRHWANSAQDMLNASLEWTTNTSIFIGAAAICDFQPLHTSEQKIKKQPNKNQILLELVKTPDVISTVQAQRKPKLIVGFSAETQDIMANAEKKRIEKKLDVIIVNDVSSRDIGFYSNENAVTIIDSQQRISLPKAPKTQIAESIMEYLLRSA